MKKNKFYNTCTYIGIVLLITLGGVFTIACASTGDGISKGRLLMLSWEMFMAITQ